MAETPRQKLERLRAEHAKTQALVEGTETEEASPHDWYNAGREKETYTPYDVSLLDQIRGRGKQPLPEVKPMLLEDARKEYGAAPSAGIGKRLQLDWLGSAAAGLKGYHENAKSGDWLKEEGEGQSYKANKFTEFERLLREREGGAELELIPILDANGEPVNLLLKNAETGQMEWIDPPGADAGDFVPGLGTGLALATAGGAAAPKLANMLKTRAAGQLAREANVVEHAAASRLKARSDALGRPGTRRELEALKAELAPAGKQMMAHGDKTPSLASGAARGLGFGVGSYGLHELIRRFFGD